MFVRLTSLFFFPDSIEEARKIFTKEIGPIVKKQSGNVSFMFLEPTNTSDDFIALTSWDSIVDAHQYETSGLYKELLEKAEKQNRVLMVELTHRYYPAVQGAKAFIESGQLGEIYAIEDRVVEAVNGQILPWMKSKAQAGGGVALTNGVHMLDRVSFLTGQSLKFEHGRVGFRAGLGDVEDTAALFLSLEDNTPVQILAAWPYGVSAPDDELTIYGSNGTLRVWAWRGWRFEPVSGVEQPLEIASYEATADIEMRIYAGVNNALGDFVDTVKSHRTFHSTAIGAIASQELIEQFYEYVGVESLVERV
ncbi:MAG: Gfo/Idh/MocA family oxidoreductase [Proteobacteria bacterium]|nr:MAG: Gfo/Idh/MocA family oxidoreductase [Pseudomonadota bacterium]